MRTRADQRPRALINTVRAGIACAGLLAAGQAMAWSIDFNDLAVGTIVDDEYAAANALAPGLSATISATEPDGATPKLPVVFDTDNPTGGDFDLGAPFTNLNNPGLGNASPGNLLILHEHPAECSATSCPDPDDEGARPAGRFFVTFSQDVFLESIDFFDVEIPAETLNTDGHRILLFADVAGTDLITDDFFVPGTGGDNTWDRLTFNTGGVQRVEIRMGGSGAIDNIVGSLPPPGVPEPATLLLLGAGLLAFGGRRAFAG